MKFSNVRFENIFCKKHKHNRDITCDECNKCFEFNCRADMESQRIQELGSPITLAVVLRAIGKSGKREIEKLKSKLK